MTREVLSRFLAKKRLFLWVCFFFAWERQIAFIVSKVGPFLMGASAVNKAGREAFPCSDLLLSSGRGQPQVLGNVDGRDEPTPKEASLSLGRGFRSRTSPSGRVIFRDFAPFGTTGSASASRESSASSTLQKEDDALEAPLFGLKTVLVGTVLLSLLKSLPRLASYDFGVRLLRGMRLALRALNKTAPLELELGSVLLGASVALLLSGLYDMVKSLYKLVKAANDELSEEEIRSKLFEFHPIRGQVLLTVGLLSVFLAQFQSCFFGEGRRDLRYAVGLTFPALFVGAVLLATSLTRRFLILSWIRRSKASRVGFPCVDCASKPEPARNVSAPISKKHFSRFSTDTSRNPG